MESHPLRMRGLKPLEIKLKKLLYVASFTDAWIETEQGSPFFGNRAVASFTDAWIETGGGTCPFRVHQRRILYGCVD